MGGRTASELPVHGEPRGRRRGAAAGRAGLVGAHGAALYLEKQRLERVQKILLDTVRSVEHTLCRYIEGSEGARI